MPKLRLRGLRVSEMTSAGMGRTSQKAENLGIGPAIIRMPRNILRTNDAAVVKKPACAHIQSVNLSIRSLYSLSRSTTPYYGRQGR